ECADTSIKMARAYWRLKGQPQKTKLIGRARGYHGVNVAGTSLGGIGGNRKMFGQLMDVDHLPHTLQPGMAFTRGMAQTGGTSTPAEPDIGSTITAAMFEASCSSISLISSLASSTPPVWAIP
ncbi:hypothetical protein ACV33H_33090, partial [Pseudomonas aeruginosa]